MARLALLTVVFAPAQAKAKKEAKPKAVKAPKEPKAPKAKAEPKKRKTTAAEGKAKKPKKDKGALAFAQKRIRCRRVAFVQEKQDELQRHNRAKGRPK